MQVLAELFLLGLWASVPCSRTVSTQGAAGVLQNLFQKQEFQQSSRNFKYYKFRTHTKQPQFGITGSPHHFLCRDHDQYRLHQNCIIFFIKMVTHSCWTLIVNLSDQQSLLFIGPSWKTERGTFEWVLEPVFSTRGIGAQRVHRLKLYEHLMLHLRKLTEPKKVPSNSSSPWKNELACSCFWSMQVLKAEADCLEPTLQFAFYAKVPCHAFFYFNYKA